MNVNMQIALSSVPSASWTTVNRKLFVKCFFHLTPILSSQPLGTCSLFQETGWYCRLWLRHPDGSKCCGHEGGYVFESACPWDFPRQEYWSGLPFPSPENLPDSGFEPASPALAGKLFTTEQPGKPTKLFKDSKYFPNNNSLYKN